MARTMKEAQGALAAAEYFGKRPAPPQKLIYVADQLNLSGIKKMQGSTRALFDTEVIQPSAARQNVSLFNNTTQKSPNFTNFQRGVLQAGETLVVEEVLISLIPLTAADLTSDATQYTEGVPVSSGPQAPFPFGTFQLKIANSTVVKPYSMVELRPELNPQNTGITQFNPGTAGEELFGSSRLKMESPPVIPPNQEIEMQFSLPPLPAITANMGLVVMIGRFGSIFSAKINL